MAGLEKNNKQSGKICSYVLLSKNILLCTFVKINIFCQKIYSYILLPKIIHFVKKMCSYIFKHVHLSKLICSYALLSKKNMLICYYVFKHVLLSKR